MYSQVQLRTVADSSPLSHVREGMDDLALVIGELGAVEGHVETQGLSSGGVGRQAPIEVKWLGHY